MDQHSAIRKKHNLMDRFRALDSLMVAYSGGVDSTFMLAVAHQVLGDRVIAATATSPVHPVREREESIRLAEQMGIEQRIFESDEIDLPEFLANGPDRCYRCKRALFRKMLKIADQRGIQTLAHGANLDDLNDYRPGLKAARELGIIAPLIDVGLRKDEIRYLSKAMGLSTWNKSPLACLASRISYGEVITTGKLRMVEQAEDYLLTNGFRQCRVRCHGDLARIEIEKDEMDRMNAAEIKEKIAKKLREIGFRYVSLDLEGYVSGSMNRTLKVEESTSDS